MTKLLDRYVLGIFLPAVAVFLVTLLFLFVSVDFASKLGKFLELRGRAPGLLILEYYVVRIPMLLIILIPSVMLFAPTFTVIKLARANELLPIASSGISLRRMSLPFVVASVFGGLSMAALDEFVLPKVGDRITETDDELASRGYSYHVEDYDGNTKLWAQKYDIQPQLLSGEVRITQLDKTKQPVEVIVAKRCQWDAKRKRWVAYEGFVEKPMEIVHEVGKKPRTWKEPIPAEGLVVESTLTPETIRKSRGVSSRFAFVPMKQLLEEFRKYPHVPATVLKVHTRFSFPLSPIVLLLLGLPFVMDPQSKSLVKGLIFCFLLALGFYMTHFSCVDLGNKGSIPPVLAAWLPVGAFGAAGLLAFYRMKT